MSEDVQQMADEIAQLMAARFGGARRGERTRLSVMLRRRGAALPRRLRRQAALLARADELSAAPKIARQADYQALDTAFRLLTAHLKPLGAFNRWQSGAVNVAASIMLGLLVLGGVALWIMVKRGLI